MSKALASLVLAVPLPVAAPPAPGSVIIDDIPGLSVLDERLELDFEGYQRWAPELVDNVDPTSPGAIGFEGAYRIWGGDGIDGVIVNVTLWPDIDDAARYVDQGAREAARIGLRTQSSPFDDVLMFEGDDDAGDFYTYLTWRHGAYGIAIVGVGERVADATVDAAREQQAALEATPPPPGDDPADDGGSGVVSIVVLTAIVVGLSWMYLSLRRSTRRQRDERDRRDGLDQTAPSDERDDPVER